MTDRPFITAREVAPLIGFRDAAAFLRHRPRLEAEEGFPEPMPTSRQPLRWRRDQVAAWVTLQGLPRGQAPERPPSPLLDRAATA